MANIGNRLTDRLGYTPLLDSVLLQFDQQILLAIPHIQALPLNQVFLTCSYIHGVRHPEGHDFSEHQHDDAIEIQYCLEGEYRIESDGQRPLPLRPGTGAVIAPGLAHRSSCTKKGARLTARAAINGPEADDFTQELQSQITSQLLSFDGQERDIILGELFHLLLTETPTAWKYEMAGGLIRNWLATTLSTCIDFTARTPTASFAHATIGNRGNALCQRANAFIYANFQRPITLDEIAEHVDITPRHLNRLFSTHVGTSVGNVLRDVRLTEAYRILHETNKPSIKEAAYRVGYVNPGYFTQCFKQRFGILPTEVHLRLSQPLADAMQYIDPQPTNN